MLPQELFADAIFAIANNDYGWRHLLRVVVCRLIAGFQDKEKGLDNLIRLDTQDLCRGGNGGRVAQVWDQPRVNAVLVEVRLQIVLG